jgi:hypothetical protein
MAAKWADDSHHAGALQQRGYAHRSVEPTNTAEQPDQPEQQEARGRARVEAAECGPLMPRQA